MGTATIARPYAVPQNGGSGRAIALALLMHLLLGGLLVFGIRWQSSPPATVQAELWSAVPQTAAPAPRPVPPPPRVEAPRPEPKPEPRPEPKPDPQPEPPKLKVDIAEKAPPKKVEPPKKKEPVKVEAPKPKPVPVPVSVPVPPKVPPAPAKVEPKTRSELAKLQQQAAVEAPPRTPSELNSLLAAAGKESNGKDQQTSGPRGDQNGYIAKLQAAIRSQMRYPATASGNPFVRVRIEQLPSGEVLNVTVVKASGVQAFDDAVERAIQAASPLPRPTQGQPQRELELTYNMYDKN